MNIAIYLNHIPRTPSLEERIARKSQKLAPFFTKKRSTGLKWHCSMPEEGVYCVEVHSSGFGFPFHASARSGKLYSAMDAALSKLERQLKKKRGKRYGTSRKESHSYKKVA